MTVEEFEEGYAHRSGITVARLHELGEGAVPCQCGEEGCEGWQMVNKAAWESRQRVLNHGDEE